MAIQHKHIKSFRFFELLIITLLWILLFMSPLLLRPSDKPVIWQEVFHIWKEQYIPLLFLFFINRFLLLPRFFFKKKRAVYFLSIIGLIALLTTGSYFYSTNARKKQIAAGRELHFPGDFRPAPEENDFLHPPLRPQAPQPQSLPPFVNLLILSVLIVGFDTGLKISAHWVKAEQEGERLLKENIETQLTYLRNQISPHFFMNTLNNVHALVDIDPEKAKEAIIMLSGMMRYLLYDAGRENMPLSKEVDFIQNYINLMKLRVSDKVRVELNIPAVIPDKLVPPLLFTSLIENAFKHGVSYEKDSFIKISLSTEEKYFTMKVENSKKKSEKDMEENSGIGIENTKKRLDLIYKDQYIFDIDDTEDLFTVTLKIPL